MSDHAQAVGAGPLGAHLDDLSDFQTYILQTQNVNAVLLAVAQSRLLDFVEDVPQSAPVIARKGGFDPGKLFRVLRFLVAQQVLECDDKGRFRQTSRSRLLHEHVSGLQFLRESMGAAQGLAECLRTGESAFECHFGMPVFDYLTQNPEVGHYFSNLMRRTTSALESLLLANHKFLPFSSVVDVGGNDGSLLVSLLERHPTSHGVVFDLKSTAERAEALTAASSVADRIQVRSGDFFQEVPENADLYLLKQILHDWSDNECVAILRNIRKAIADDGRLALIEYLLPGTPQHHPGFAMDIHMMVLSSGCERTREEYELLIEAAGFRLERITESTQGLSVIEAVPA